jgi:hypothetical protein
LLLEAGMGQTPANNGNAFTHVVVSGGGFWRCKMFTEAQIVRHRA